MIANPADVQRLELRLIAEDLGFLTVCLKHVTLYSVRIRKESGEPVTLTPPYWISRGGTQEPHFALSPEIAEFLRHRTEELWRLAAERVPTRGYPVFTRWGKNK